jgi:regulatory protein
MNDSESFQRAAAAASRLLFYRPRSTAELRTRLNQRFPTRVVDQVVESLVKRGHLDDVSFARLWTNSRDANSPRSASAIKRELLAKGISPDLASAAVGDVDDPQNAYRVALKTSRRLEDATPLAFRRRLWGYLRRRGFSESITRVTIDKILADRPSPNDEESEAW